MARGGRRAGKVGKAYGNRTDLNGGSQAKIPGQGYGEQAAQVRSQQAVPVQEPPAQRSLDDLLAGAPNPHTGPTLLGGESGRPGEPITAGLPTGPGPGPEALLSPAMFAPRRPGIDELEALYQVFPYEGIRRLLEANARNR